MSLIPRVQISQATSRSCSYGNNIACDYAEEKLERIKEQERLDALMEYGEFDLEKAQDLERQYEQEQKKWEGKYK